MKTGNIHTLLLCVMMSLLVACDGDDNTESDPTEEDDVTIQDETQDEPDPADPEDPDPQEDPENTETQGAVTRFIAVGDAGRILYSDDHGSSWTQVTSGTTETLRDATGDNHGNCVVVGYNGTVLYSEDSGLTWQAGSVQTINHIKDVESFGDGKFVAVAEPTGPDPYAIFRSTNGGKTWDRYPATVVLRGIGMRSATDFVAVGNVSGQNEGVALLTYTGGDHWGMLTVGSGQFPASTSILYDVVHSGSYFIAVGRGMTLYSQGGGNWTIGSSLFGSLYRAVRCNTSNRTVAVGTGCEGGPCTGRIMYSTTLRGTSWTEVTIANLEFLHDVETDGRGRFVAVGEGGVVMYSVDTGNMSESATVWERGTSGVSGYLWGVGACDL